MSKALLIASASLLAVTSYSYDDKSGAPAQAKANTSRLVQVNANGSLSYQSYSEKGDVLPDFSYVGYGFGISKIPDVPTVKVVEPSPGDNREAIQKAIDEVQGLPIGEGGYRGAIELKAGTYEVGDSLRISASGVVLRGAGSEKGTTLVATRRAKHDFIIVSGEGEREPLSDQPISIIDEYIPVGAMSFHVDHPENLKVGDRVIVRRPSTAEWIKGIGMDRIPPRPDGGPVNQWTEGKFDLKFDRTITAIEGPFVTIDAPLTNAFQKEYGGGTVEAYEFPGRISRVGIEGLRLVSAFNPEINCDETGPRSLYKEENMPCDEDHGWAAITFDKVEHAWVRDVTSVHFAYGCVDLKRDAKNVSVIGCRSLDPVSKISGSRRYGFNIGGQLCLVKDSFSRKHRHDFAADSRLPGPNAFVNCRSEHSYSTSEPHHRWAAGVLYDNVRIEGPAGWLMANNRSWLGSGHGWAGAQIVFWNCSAAVIGVAKPPSAQNFAIGISEIIPNPPLVAYAVEQMNKTSGLNLPPNPPFWGDGYTESPDGPVEPRSLYEAQLRMRAMAKDDGNGEN